MAGMRARRSSLPTALARRPGSSGNGAGSRTGETPLHNSSDARLTFHERPDNVYDAGNVVAHSGLYTSQSHRKTTPFRFGTLYKRKLTILRLAEPAVIPSCPR